MNHTLLRLITALCLLGAQATWAGTHRLDDSLSHTVPPTAQMQWRPMNPGEADGGMEAWVRVNIHVDTRSWAGQSGRVYMVLPRDQSSPIEAMWSTLGRLLPGRLVSGDRTLVYAGTMPADALQDQLQLRLRSGADWQTSQRRLNFHFEIDTDR